jgi:hypothetical protein
MAYVKITNGSVDTFPYTIGQLRRDNPNVSFPRQVSDEILASYGVYSVTVEAAPSINNRTQNATRNDTPTGSGSTWTLGWTTTAKTAEETTAYDDAMAADKRATRDAKLAETDFYALSDVTMSAEMTTYRQALRDITTHANWPNLADDDWPTKP